MVSVWGGMFLASPWSWLAERQISSVPFNVGIEKDEGSVLNWSHWWCSVDGDVTTLPGRSTARGTAGTCFAVGGIAAGTVPFVCRERSISCC